jgi:hypothetical protein
MSCESRRGAAEKAPKTAETGEKSLNRKERQETAKGQRKTKTSGDSFSSDNGRTVDFFCLGAV